MKRGVFSILAILAVFAMVTLGCPEPPAAVIKEEIKLLSVIPDGVLNVSTTTELKLTFSKAITDLTKDDITLTGGTVTKGELSQDPDNKEVYTLPISGFTADATLTVAVNKPGADDPITGSPKQVKIYYKAPNPGDIEATLNSVTANGSVTETTTQLTLTFDKAIPGLNVGDIELSGVSGVAKESLALGQAGTYNLKIKGFTAGGELTVTVTKIGYAIKGGGKKATIFYVEEVAFTNLTANGKDKESTTTEIQLAFDKAIPGLSESDIEISGVPGVTIDGTISNPSKAPLYILKIKDFYESGNLTVTVKKTGYKFTPATKNVDIHFLVVDVEFSELTADGDETTTTTELTLTFDKEIPGLSASNITLTPAGIKMGLLVQDDTEKNVYTLPISDFTVNDDGEATLTVTVSKPPSYNITTKDNEPMTVTVYLVKVPVTLNSITANGAAGTTTTDLTLTFDKEIPGLSADDITLSGVAGVEKGDLTATATAGTYTLPISGFTAGGPLTVAVSKFGYDIVDEDDKPFVSTDVTIYYSNIAVTFDGVTANGSATETTTTLTLTFDKAIEGLAATDFTLTGVAGVTAGALGAATGAGPVTYTLGISGATAGGTLSVAVAKDGFTITGSPQTVDIFYVASAEVTFDNANAIKVLTVGGEGSQISVDTVTGIISRAINNTDYGNYFTVAIPDDQLPIIASDTIVITYIGKGNAPLTTKKNSALADINPADYYTFTGDEKVNTKRINAVAYGDTLPTSVLYFQGRPNTAAWELKILSITVEHGNPIKVDAPVAGLKPASGAVPVTEIDTLQYTGTVTWSSSPATFAAGTAYTATITLTKKAGYTFDGIAANGLTVTGADTVTHVAGDTGNTLAITAVFPATAAPAPAKVITFTDGDVKATGTTTIVVDDANTFTATNGTPNYQGAVVYFKVKFEGTYKLSDYSKIDISTTALNSDAQWKPLRIGAFKDEPAEASLASTSTDVIAAQESGNPVGSTGDGTKNITLTIGAIPSDADLNEVWIGICVHAGANAEYKLANIKFYN